MSQAASAGLVPNEDTCSELLDAIVDAGRRAFGAAACSVTLLDEESDELVFTAVAGEGADTIIGDRFPAEVGISGWVLTSQQPLAVHEVQSDPRFAADVAERTGYVPKAMMAAPLLSGEDAIGVLAVLDRDSDAMPELTAMDLLTAFARQASIAANLLDSIRKVSAVAQGDDPELAAVARLATALDGLSPNRREHGVTLLTTLEKLLARG